MVVEYIGRNNEYFENKQPFALISYSETREQETADKVFKILRDKGWTIEEEDECGSITLIDREEFDAFKQDYKAAKRESKLK